MVNKLSSLEFWEALFLGSIILYVVDNVFLFSIFYVTIPLVFLLGVVACIFAIKEKKYLNALACIIGIFLPICWFIMMPW